MSMMGTEHVGLDFSVTGNYGASLTQMIQQADAYARSADTMIGKIASLNVITTGLLAKTTALTGANRVATAEAAAYQQKLATLAPTAAIVGTNFGRLTSQTMDLARQFGSIDAAVATMKTLQQSGLGANDSMAKLAKTFMQLDAANDSFGGQIGSGLLTLGRTFGNSTAQLSKFGDSLTTLSARYGANAQGALAFAQALAPVASSVGVAQGAVLGLGTAAARLGQDGYAGANAFNKVLLDMSSSIRNGNPQIKEYAQLLNMTTTQLAQMFKTDPSEVVLRFTEAIGKGGANAQRSLEALGFDAVRTTKALTAISSQGNLRQIVDDAAKSYGNGSTEKAAESALDTVNHKAQVLQETLSQTVSNAGKPFLSWLGDVESAAIAAAGAINNVIASAPVQTFGSVAAPVAFAGGAVARTAGLLGTVALGRQAFNYGRDKLKDFTGAAAFVRGGGSIAEDASLLVRAGGAYGAAVPELPSVGPGAAVRGTRAFVRGALNAGAGAFAYQRNMYAGADYRSQGGDFEATQRYFNPATATRKAEMTAIGASVAADKSLGNLARQGAAAGTSLGRFVKSSLAADGALERLAVSAGSAGKAMLMYGGRELGAAGGVLRRGAGAAGNVLSALSGGLVSGPVGLGIAGAAAVGFGIKSYNDDQARIREEGRASMTDVYGQFNDFAAAAGIAGKGAVSLAEALTASTQQILSSNKTMEQAYSPSTDVQAMAAGQGYNRAFTAITGSDPQLAALQARLMLGGSPSIAATGRTVADLYNQGGAGFGAAAATSLRGLTQGPMSDVYKQFVGEHGVAATSSWVFGRQTDDTAKLVNGLVGTIGDAAEGVREVYGDQAANLKKLQESSALFDAARANPTMQQTTKGAVADVLAQTTGVDNSDALKALVAKGTRENKSLSQLFQEVAGSRDQGKGLGFNEEDFAKIRELAKMGDLSKVNYQQFYSTPETQKSAQKIEQAFGPLKSASDSLTTALFGAEAAARKLGITVDKVTPEQVVKEAGIVAAAVNASAANPERADLRVAAGNEVAGAATRGSGGNLGTAILQLQAQQGNLSENDPRRKIIDVALQQLGRQQGVQLAGMGTIGRYNQQLDTAQRAAAMGAQTDPAAEQARQAALDQGAAAMQGKMDFLKQFIQADKNLQIQLTRQDEDAEKARARSTRDYLKQTLYAEQDFGKQRMRAQRDFGISMTRAAEDAAKSIYKPYERIAAQQVWDANSLIANMQEQNQAIVQQTQNVARLRKLGLSQQAVDQLSLSDSSNAQQVDRLLGDLLADPTLIRKLNQTAQARGAAAKGATQNANNVDYRRASEDFRKSMKDSSVDFATSMKRAADAHRIALDDMATDLNQSRKRAQEDLARMGDEVTGTLTSLETDFLGRVAKLPTGMTAAMSTNLKLMIAEASSQAGTTLDTVLKPWGLTADSLAGLIRGAVVSTTYGEHSGQGTGQNQSGRGGSTQMGGLPNSAAGALRTAASISAGPAMKPGLCDHFVGEAYGLAHSGYPSARDHWLSTPGKYRYPGSASAPAGALVFWDVGKDGHVALSAGGGMVWSTDFKRQGHVDLVPINEISRRWGPLYGWSQPYFGGKTTPLERGGVATRRLHAELAEHGPEVVLPLNQHGARAMAEAMGRYLSGDAARSARVAPYATPAVNYVYDQRVMVTGPVTVEAQDPNQMGRKLAQKQRLDALRQPVGSRR